MSVLTRPAYPELLFALEVVHDGLTPETAAALAGVTPDAVRANLSAARRAGFIV